MRIAKSPDDEIRTEHNFVCCTWLEGREKKRSVKVQNAYIKYMSFSEVEENRTTFAFHESSKHFKR